MNLQTLHQMYVVNAGSGFKLIWNSVKGFLDPKTSSKIHVSSMSNLLTWLMFHIYTLMLWNKNLNILLHRFLVRTTRADLSKLLTQGCCQFIVSEFFNCIFNLPLTKIRFCVCVCSELPKFLGGSCQCSGKGGCLGSNRGPWNDPVIMKVS